MRTPEEYMRQTLRPPEEALDVAMSTEAEQAFALKYLGIDAEQALAELPRVDPTDDDVALAVSSLEEPRPEATDAGNVSVEPEASPEATTGVGSGTDCVTGQPALSERDDMQLVGFLLDGREFALPIEAIQEVIRYMEPTRLPTAPSFLEGIVNLRGRVTPLIDLRQLLHLQRADDAENRFIVVCGHSGLQVGLIVSAIATIHRPAKDQMEWNIERQVGISADLLEGIMKDGERLINILSVDRLVERLAA